MMVTTNVFAAPPHLVLERQYDLKGSTANRFISAQEQASAASAASSACLWAECYVLCYVFCVLRALCGLSAARRAVRV